ncbi:hypothetical protein JZ751_023312 [Albula glossodonta]|uniref:Solute carrier family 66 member 3 n=1 Tax=Albula glossodonta TaxID=121402 RepID=A0A8T2NIY4_9TELE|nr:hypothetical protein JZ751_023312 [Albula glossodonta]
MTATSPPKFRMFTELDAFRGEGSNCNVLWSYQLYAQGHCQESGTAKTVTTRRSFIHSYINSEMGADAVLHFANLSAMLSCMVLKLPQIFLLMKVKSTKGVSLQALLLELTGYLVFMTYQMYHEYPIPTYLEYPVLIAQDTILLLLILHYNGNLRQSVVYSAMFVGGWQLLTLQGWIIDLAMSLCTFISAGSKFAQLQCLWRSKDSATVSAASWTMSFYTCMVRIFTTIMTTGDPLGECCGSEGIYGSVYRHDDIEWVGDTDSAVLPGRLQEAGLSVTSPHLSATSYPANVRIVIPLTFHQFHQPQRGFSLRTFVPLQTLRCTKTHFTEISLKIHPVL